MFFRFFDFFELFRIFFVVVEFSDLFFFGIFSNLLKLLLNAMEVTTEHQKRPKISRNSVKSSFIAQRTKKGLSFIF